MPQVVVAATLRCMNAIESLVDVKFLRMREVCTRTGRRPSPAFCPSMRQPPAASTVQLRCGETLCARNRARACSWKLLIQRDVTFIRPSIVVAVLITKVVVQVVCPKESILRATRDGISMGRVSLYLAYRLRPDFADKRVHIP